MKVLVISQHLFPIQTPRANRTTELVKEFSRKGHEVTLYAVLGEYDYSSFEKEFNLKVKNIKIHFQKHPYNSDGDGKRTLIDKILGRLLSRAFEFPNIEFKFKVPQIIQKEKDSEVLITIADPHQIHWGAARERKKNPKQFPKVWIADCGDPFMSNGKSMHHYSYFDRFERLFCEQCDLITVPLDEAKKGYYPEYRNKIKVIPQGFEFDTNTTIKAPINEVVTFAYAGTFYKDIRNPSKFLDLLASRSENFKFIVYTLFTELILPYKEVLGSRLEIRKPLKRNDLIEELKTMDFLVNIENVNSPTQIPSKLIDYAITNRPILSIDPTQPDKNKINSFLERNYTERFLVDNIEQYHISQVVDKFIALF
jgi:hypothetical protein